MPKVFVWRSCGLQRPNTQTDVVPLTRNSACSRPAAPRHMWIKYSLPGSLPLCLAVVNETMAADSADCELFMFIAAMTNTPHQWMNAWRRREKNQKSEVFHGLSSGL